MPFICLANANVPNGVLQITDLWPNTSLRNQVLDPPGQTRYLNRPAGDTVVVAAGVLSPAATLADHFTIEGLAAYIADVVDPGGSEQATGTITMAGPLVGDTVTFLSPATGLSQAFTAVESFCVEALTVNDPTAALGRLTLGTIALDCVEDAATGTITTTGVLVGDTVTIAGVLFTAAAAADLPNQVFDQSAGDNATATSLAAAINHANAQALLTAALDVLVPAATAGTLTGGAALNVVTLTPSVLGVWGDAALLESTGGARIALSGAAMTHVDPIAANQEFGSAAHYEGQTDPSISVATSIVATVNDAATIALMDAANPGPAPAALNGHMTAANGGGTLAVVTLTSSQIGWAGQLATTTTEGAELVLPTATLARVGSDPTLFQFDSLLNASTNVLSATSLVTTLNNAVTDAALVADGGSSVTATNVGGTSAVVTATADTAGSDGAMLLIASAAARTVLSANAMAKTMNTWTAALLNASAAAVQALVDAGTAATVTTINAAMNAIVGVSGISIATGHSSLADILSILAGRVYQVTVPILKETRTGFFWRTAADGGFTTPNTVYDTHMVDGEWSPVAIGGDVVNNEIGGIRSTYNSTHLQTSILTGQLGQYAAGVTLFPDPEVQHWVGDFFRRTGRQAPLLNQRVVTVYDDDGALLV